MHCRVSVQHSRDGAAEIMRVHPILGLGVRSGTDCTMQLSFCQKHFSDNSLDHPVPGWAMCSQVANNAGSKRQTGKLRNALRSRITSYTSNSDHLLVLRRVPWPLHFIG